MTDLQALLITMVDARVNKFNVERFSNGEWRVTITGSLDNDQLAAVLTCGSKVTYDGRVVEATSEGYR